MSTLEQKKSSLQTAPAKQPKYIYLGLNESGRVRLQLGDKTLLINGAVYASTKPVAGRTKIALVPINATLGYKRQPEHKKYLVRTATGETLRVIGIIEKIHTPVVSLEKKSVRTILTSTSNAPNSLSSPSKPPVKHAAPDSVPVSLKQAVSKPVDTKKEAKLARLQKEFQRVAAQRTSGVDPTVRMAFVAYYLGESESNLYRRRADGQFPTSIQRGKGTFWRMSDLDAFKAGTWKPAD